jgi:hypothetical protein
VKLVIENVAPGGPAHTVTFDGRSYSVRACAPSDGGMTETYELEGDPTPPIVVNVHVQGSIKSDRELAETIQRELQRRPPGRAT